MAIEKLTVRHLIRKVVERFSRQYDRYVPPDPRYNFTKLIPELEKLDLETCAAEAVEHIIGNQSWTTLTCDQCKNKVEQVVILNDGDDYHFCYICENCIKESLKLFAK